MSGMLLAKPLGLEGKPVTRVENMCATGSEALRQAAYAVASGAYDLAMAVGVEKVKDSGYQGLNAFPVPNDGTPAHAHRGRHVLDGRARLRRALRRADGRAQGRARPHRVEEPLQRRPQPAGAVPAGDVGRADPRHARGGRLPRRCSTAPAWPTARRPPSSCRAEDAHRYTDTPLYVKALSFVAGNGSGLTDPDYDYTTFPEIVALRRGRLRPGRASPTRAPSSPWPRCTTASRPPSSCSWRTSASASGARRGRRSRRAPSTSTATCPVNPDGGLKSFGHPVGASGLRMMFEAWLQLRGEAPGRAPDRHHRRPPPRPHPQPRRLPRRDGQLRRHPRHLVVARLTASSWTLTGALAPVGLGFEGRR